MPKAKKILRILLFILEILLLIAVLGGLYLFTRVEEKIDNIEQPVLKETEIVVNDQTPIMTGYKTYALFGIDHRDKNAALSGENTDTMIIASVNNDTKDVKLVSLYRDTFLNIGSDTYSKANAAYAMGGPEQAISMLNTNLDLKIDDYATVDFNALTTAIDCLGGLEIPLTYAEMVHLNNYCVEVAEETGGEYTPLELLDTPPEDQEAIYGTYHLNGIQVTSYCRIRYTANLDMGRTERQRRVIQLLTNKAKTASLSTLFDIMDQVFPMVKTSVTKTELLSMLPSLMGYSMNDTMGFPVNYKFSNVKGSIIVCTDLVKDVEELHRFLYGETGYKVSDVIQQRADKIHEIVNSSELSEEAVLTEENTANDTYVYTEDSSGNGHGYNSYSDYYNDGDYSGGSSYSGDYSGGDYNGGSSYSGDTGGDYGGDYGGDNGGDYSGGDTGGDYGGDTGGDYGGDNGGDYSGGDTGGDYGGDNGGDYSGGDYTGDYSGDALSDGNDY